jgi:ligand-binding sensor domain-containing protein
MCKLCHILSLCGCLLGCAVIGFAQEKQLLTMEYFDENKGLNLNGLNDIFQDREGFLWLTTPEGVVRFDGHSFRTFRNVPGDSTSIYGNNTTFLAEDSDGSIWVGLNRGGICRYDRKTGRFRNYPFTEKLKVKTASVLYVFIDKDGEVWLGVSDYGLVHLDKKTGAVKTYDLVTPQSEPGLAREVLANANLTQHIWQDEEGLLWCATPFNLYSFDPKTKKATAHRYDKKAFDGTLLSGASTLFPEGDFLWVGGWSSGLRRYNRKTGEWKQFMLVQNPPSPDAVNVVNGILPKSPDELWITSSDRGFGIFNKKTEQFTILGQDSLNYRDFPTSSSGKIYKDRQGNIWVNQNGQLLRIQLKTPQFQFNSTRSGRPITKEMTPVSTMMDDREGHFRFIGLYAGDGLQVLDKKTGKTTVPDFIYQVPNDESNHFVIDMLEARNGTIWILCKHVLYRFNPQTMRLEVPPQPPIYLKEYNSNFYNQITEDLQGNLWLCTSISGVFRYNPTTGESVHFMPDEKDPGAIATNVVGSMRTDSRGRVWYGSRNETTYGYYLPSDGQFHYLDANGKPTKELVSLRMNSFFTDRKGDIWACTEQGLLHFDCSGDQPVLVKKYDTLNGLPFNYVLWGLEDDNGNIWIVLFKQLCKLNIATGQITSYGKKDGLPTWEYGLAKLQQNVLAMYGINGYYTFGTDALRAYQSNSPIVLTSFKVNDEERYMGSELSISEPLAVPADGRYFSLEFASLDFTHPELNRFEYQLQGLDNQWVKAGSRRLVNYTNVPAGHYSFLVKMEGRPDSEAFVVPLVVRVEFYKKAWFWALVSLAFAGVVIAYFRNRQIQRQKMSELLGKAQLLEKEKAVVQYESLKQQLNPHFLFNSLTSLGSLISISPKEAATFLDSLSKTYRYILKSSERETVPLVEELKFGETFVKLQKTRFGEGLQVNFKVDEADFHRKIVPVTLQNLIENAIKHNIIDEEEPLVIDVTVEEGYLVVRNNLQKKKFVETSNKRGLANLQSFYRYLSDKPIEVAEDEQFFRIRIPLV